MIGAKQNMPPVLLVMNERLFYTGTMETYSIS